MSRYTYTFPDKPIFPVRGPRKIRNAVDKWMKSVEHYNPNSDNIKSFKEMVDEVILKDVIEQAQKENNEKEIKEFLEDVSTKLGEDE